MKFILHIGPDTFGLVAKKKSYIKRAIKRAMSKRVTKKSKCKNSQYDIAYKYKGSNYTYGELLYAEILTYAEYFKHIKK